MISRKYSFNNSSVTIIFGNILDSQKEVLVSSDDCYITMGGGISGCIVKTGGRAIYDDAQKQIPAKLGNAIVTTAGSLKQKYIFHAITIDNEYAHKRHEEDSQQKLEIQEFIVVHSVKYCLRLLSNLGLSSIAFPAIGAGVARIPYKKIAQSMASAISEFLTNTNKHFEIEIYLYDRYGKMENWDFLPFFESFSSAEACSEQVLKFELHKQAVGENNEKLDFSDVEISKTAYTKHGIHKIFISYSRKDEDKTKGICSLLNDMGIPYWIDVDGTYSGENFKEVIVNAIKQSQLVLFVSTKNSNASLNVAKEISLADKYNKVVIPIKLDNSPFAPKIDYDLNCIDAIELYDFTQEQMEKLRKCIQGKLAIENSKVK